MTPTTAARARMNDVMEEIAKGEADHAEWVAGRRRVFGSLLRECREQQRMTMRALARKAGYSAAFIHDIEHGRRMPGEDARDAIYTALFGRDPK